MLRILVDAHLASLPLEGLSVLELGGRKGGFHSMLCAEKGCRYFSVGFEGDIRSNLNTGVPVRSDSVDVVLISMVLMYLGLDGALEGAIAEARRTLRKGGRILIFESFLAPETSHKEVEDLSRLTAPGMGKLLSAHGFANVRLTRLGGIFGCAGSVLTDMLPGFLWPIRFLALGAAGRADAYLGNIPYFKRRNERNYLGYFACAEKGKGP